MLGDETAYVGERALINQFWPFWSHRANDRT